MVTNPSAAIKNQLCDVPWPCRITQNIHARYRPNESMVRLADGTV